MHYHTNCTCWTFLNCVFNVSSTCMSGRMQSHTNCIYNRICQNFSPMALKIPSWWSWRGMAKCRPPWSNQCWIQAATSSLQFPRASNSNSLFVCCQGALLIFQQTGREAFSWPRQQVKSSVKTEAGYMPCMIMKSPQKTSVRCSDILKLISVKWYTGCFFLTGTPPKYSKYKKVNLG